MINNQKKSLLQKIKKYTDIHCILFYLFMITLVIILFKFNYNMNDIKFWILYIMSFIGYILGIIRGIYEIYE